MIRVCNQKTYSRKDGEMAIFIGRKSSYEYIKKKYPFMKDGTIFGNPFNMNNETQRNLVCDKYTEYFNEQKKGGKFKKVLDRLVDISKQQDIALVCFCAPKRCHGDTIKACCSPRSGCRC